MGRFKTPADGWHAVIRVERRKGKKARPMRSKPITWSEARARVEAALRAGYVARVECDGETPGPWRSAPTPTPAPAAAARPPSQLQLELDRRGGP